VIRSGEEKKLRTTPIDQGEEKSTTTIPNNRMTGSSTSSLLSSPQSEMFGSSRDNAMSEMKE
jgi:hypothetical protein